MDRLLTIKEYKERAIENISNIVKNGLNKSVLNDWIIFNIISNLAEETFTYHIGRKEQANQMFLKVFGTDKNGTPISDMLYTITSKEVKAFNNQYWFRNHFAECKKHYDHYYPMRVFTEKIRPCGWCDSDFDFYNVVLQPFEDDINTAYNIAVEVFKRVYGYDYDIDNVKINL